MKTRLKFLLLLPLLTLVIGLGCKSSLAPGGAYSPTDTNGVALSAPDMPFYVADSAFDFAYSTVDAAFNFERDNRASLWLLSQDVKKNLDAIRPQAVMLRNEYLTARVAYIQHPTPAGLTTLQTILTKIQTLAVVAQAALPQG